MHLNQIIMALFISAVFKQILPNALLMKIVLKRNAAMQYHALQKIKLQTARKCSVQWIAGLAQWIAAECAAAAKANVLLYSMNWLLKLTDYLFGFYFIGVKFLKWLLFSWDYEYQ
jgi:hypothetical protein